MEKNSLEEARQKVMGPALSLIITCCISIGILLLAQAFDAWLLLSGAAEKLKQPQGVSKKTQITVRITWSVLILATNIAILAGAMRMKGLRSLSFSRTACILALIPCLGPCLIFGIPFGIWGLVVLSDARVRKAFES